MTRKEVIKNKMFFNRKIKDRSEQKTNFLLLRLLTVYIYRI